VGWEIVILERITGAAPGSDLDYRKEYRDTNNNNKNYFVFHYTFGLISLPELIAGAIIGIQAVAFIPPERGIKNTNQTHGGFRI